MSSVIDRGRAVRVDSAVAECRCSDERDAKIRKARQRERGKARIGGSRAGARRLTSLFSCASADLNVRLIHSFTSKLSSENAETS